MKKASKRTLENNETQNSNSLKVLVIGDSHAAIFKIKLFNLFRKFLLPNITFEVFSVLGATISGIENPNSKTKAGEIFNNAIINNKHVKYCILQMGEVDTGFVLWYKHENEGISIDALMVKSVNRYKQLIDKVLVAGYTPIIISTPLPTIKDNCVWGEVSNLRKTIKANQIERTQLTIKFNTSIREYCNGRGIHNLNLDNISKGSKGVVKTFLRHYNKKDHHYNPITYSILLILKLRKIIK